MCNSIAKRIYTFNLLSSILLGYTLVLHFIYITACTYYVCLCICICIYSFLHAKSHKVILVLYALGQSIHRLIGPSVTKNEMSQIQDRSKLRHLHAEVVSFYLIAACH
jgi:hypothetical protein